MLEIALAFGLAIVSFLTAGFMLAFLLAFVFRSLKDLDDNLPDYDEEPRAVTLIRLNTEDGPTEVNLEDYIRAMREGKQE